jgi:hypothetical protein
MNLSRPLHSLKPVSKPDLAACRPDQSGLAENNGSSGKFLLK